MEIFDYADREASLSVTTPAGTTSVVTGTSYLPSGPLTTLTFGTGAWEDRSYDSRYFPESIILTATKGRSWDYTLDAVGNPTEIVEMALCPGDLTLANATITTAELFESCDAITVGPDVTVAAGADVDLRAATRISIGNGFSVESGASFSAGVDPTLTGDITRSYTYQDIDYFLTAATGGWGSQSWTYDKIGNRLSETDNGATDTYSYTPNGTGGNTARLASVQLSTVGTRTYGYTPAGHVDDVTAGANVIDFSWDDAGRLAGSDRASDTAGFLYDGRSFLRQAGDAGTVGLVEPTYDSDGLLHSLYRDVPNGQTRYHVFYLAGRPVGQVATEAGEPERWWYFTTDHLGTPVVATDGGQDELWVNRFDPFGEDPFAGTASGALAQEVFLRFPGQWDDEVWRGAMMGAEGYYNVHRWLELGTGRYSRPDPLGRRGGRNWYGYAEANPVKFSDLLGLTVYKCCAPADIAFGLVDHCWIKSDTREAGLGNLDEGQPPGEAIPGDQCDSPYITQTQVVDHTGASTNREGAHCEEVPDADEECVNQEIWTSSRGYGPTKGSFTLGNNCQTWADGVLNRCRKRCKPTPPVDLPPGLPPFKGFF